MKKRSDQKVKAAGILLMSRWNTIPEFLLLRHPDRWDLPKGHCKPSESFEQAALRETEEETGIPAREIQLDEDFVFDITYPVTYARTGSQVFQKQVRYFLGYLAQRPQLSLTEHPDAKWFRWNPPHHIQAQTIDPLLAALADHLATKKKE
jgi:8-oxo-dGTP pyrophosphatase MutT (NUDIX family)